MTVPYLSGLVDPDDARRSELIRFAMTRICDAIDIALLSFDAEIVRQTEAERLEKGVVNEEQVVAHLRVEDELLKYREYQVGDSEEKRGLMAVAKLSSLSFEALQEALNA